MTQPTLTIKAGSRLQGIRCEDMQILIESDRLLDEGLAPVDWLKEIFAELDIGIDGCNFTNCTFGTTAMLAQQVADLAIKAAREGPSGGF